MGETAKIINMPAGDEAPPRVRLVRVTKFRGVSLPPVSPASDAVAAPAPVIPSEPPPKVRTVRRASKKKTAEKKTAEPKKRRTQEEMFSHQLAEILASLPEKDRPTFFVRLMWMLASIFMIMPSEEEQIQLVQAECGIKHRKLRARAAAKPSQPGP